MKRIIALILPVLFAVVAFAGPAAASTHPHAKTPPTMAARNAHPAATPDTGYGPYAIWDASDFTECWQANGVGNQITVKGTCNSTWTLHSNSTTGVGWYYFQDANGNCAYENSSGQINLISMSACSSSDHRDLWGEGSSGGSCTFGVGKYTYTNEEWGDVISVAALYDGAPLFGGTTNNYWRWCLN